MIPYFELRAIPVPGGASVAAFGTLVAIGVFAGALFAESRARKLGIPLREVQAAIVWVVLPGFALAHLASLVWDAGAPGADAGWNAGAALRFWNGMSSFGGFAGALAGLLLFRWTRPRAPALAVAEVLVQALVVGWVFGRLGCALVHDHVGKSSDFWLAVRFPGGPRHDLGLYELLYTVLVLVPAVAILNRRPRPPGATIACIALLYAPARFAADFLRNADLPGAEARVLGLTLGQYGSLALACVGIAFALRIRRHGLGVERAVPAEGARVKRREAGRRHGRRAAGRSIT